MPRSDRSAVALVLLGVLVAVALPAQQPYKVRSFNPPDAKENGLASREVLMASHGVYYSFDDGLHGPEPWRDGSLVRDLCPGPCGSSPSGFIELDGNVYFLADDGASGRALWQTDGTPGGTTLVRVICLGTCPGPDPGAAPVRAGHSIFFRARDENGFVALWTSDGTWEGTHRVAVPCPHCAGFFDLTAAGSTVFFRADDGAHGLEAWKSDGTENGTGMLRDDCPGSCSSGPAGDQRGTFTPFGDGVLYWQLEPVNPPTWRLRASAGDAVEKGLVIEVATATPPRLLPLKGAFLFAADFFVGKIDPGTFTLSVLHSFAAKIQPGTVAPFQDIMLFQGNDPLHGAELWMSDGTAAGTQLLVDTVPGPESGSPMELAATTDDNYVFFTENGGLWVSNLTAAGTRRLFSEPFAANLTPLRYGVSFITGDPGLHTAVLQDVGIPLSPFVTISLRSLGSVPGPVEVQAPTSFGGALLFGQGGALWKSDGTANGTTVLSEMAKAPTDAAPFQGGLLFLCGSQLCKTDGTPAGTGLFLLPSYFSVERLKVNGDQFFFSGWTGYGRDANTGFELWRFDPKYSEIFLVKDIVPAPGPDPHQVYSSHPSQLTPLGSHLFFVANTPDTGTELWTSDGTDAGTSLLSDLCPGPCSPDLTLLNTFAGRLYFTTRGMLLSTDGNASAPFSSFARFGRSKPNLVVFQNRLFYFAEDSFRHEYLWSSDGTLPGTVRIQEVSGADQPRSGHEPVVAGSLLYFTSWTADAGQELWVSDGTAAGTHMLADVRPGPDGSSPRHLTAVGRRVFFAADEGIAGQELWTTDGTAAGTHRLGDIAPGPASAAPEQLTAAGNLLFFTAADGQNSGRQLWAVDTTQAFEHCTHAADRLCLDGGRFEVAVTFRDQHNGGTTGRGTAVPDGDQGGFFWFFSPENLELVVKVLDGRAGNGHFWVFFGALSDVEYDVTVTDRATGAVRTYHNPAGTFCGQADTAAFVDLDATAPAVPARPAPASAAEATDSCIPSLTTLCLVDGRYRVEARWKDQHNGGLEGTATAVPRSRESGSFWFFARGNTELVVKVLDGTPVNHKVWVFYGALSDVEYWLTVTDTVTGAAKTYHNLPGSYCGQGDTAAL
jgi:ELWxxDGT repeat protein